MTTVFGWWDWDTESPSLVNRVTGESVVFSGEFRDPDLVQPDETWLRFDYRHKEVTFPVLVEAFQVKKQHQKNRLLRAGEIGQTVWRLDYRRSWALAKRERGIEGAHPPYGLWRRIDDCVSDALACWPESDAISKGFAEKLRFDGAWLDGAWSAKTQRWERRFYDPKGSDDVEDYSPWLMPLDAPAPSPFEFHDLRGPPSGADPLIAENPVLLTGLEFDDPELRFRPKLPEDSDLTQLAGRAPHLLSGNGRRLLYPYFGQTQKPEGTTGHWSPLFSLLYVDDRITTACSAKVAGPNAACNLWTLGTAGHKMQLRQNEQDPSSQLIPGHLPPGKPEHWRRPPTPSRALWRQIQWDLVGGWCAWPGTAAHHPRWLPPLALEKVDGVLTSSGYRGGRWLIATDFTVIS